METETAGWRDEWPPGTVAWFEYHCQESDDSDDADLWYRSHQQDLSGEGGAAQIGVLVLVPRRFGVP